MREAIIIDVRMVKAEMPTLPLLAEDLGPVYMEGGCPG